MAYEEVTSPILTDATGQDIVDKLDEIAQNLQPPTNIEASDVSYDNTQSGMTATDVQGAVTELKSNLTDSGWQTIADYYQYRKLNGVIYVRKKNTTQISITSSFSTLFTLPTGFRPTESNGSFVYSVPAMAQAQGIQIKVLDTGEVQAAAQFGSNTPVMYQWAISFPLG